MNLALFNELSAMFLRETGCGSYEIVLEEKAFDRATQELCSVRGGTVKFELYTVGGVVTISKAATENDCGTKKSDAENFVDTVVDSLERSLKAYRKFGESK